MVHATSILRARWVFPVDRAPIENGMVEIANGRIINVRSADRFARISDEEAQSALIPGLVNAHTHLEFSDLAAPLSSAGTFADWIALIVQHRRERTADVSDVIASGLAESAAAGVTTVGEIATAGWSRAPFGVHTLRTVGFREAIALDPARYDDAYAAVHRHLQDLRSDPSLVGGISPHAPYSVAPPLFERLVDLAHKTDSPLAVHLAETREELQLLSEGSGPLVELFRDGGFWRPDAIPRGTRPLDYLRQIASLPRALVIHGNYLDDDECAFLEGRPNLSVVYCPRTHAHFRHAPHPWLDLRQRGVRVALGTDSRASNPDLSLWREVQFLHARFPQVDPSGLLEMATRSGSAALGLDSETGTLTPGKAADVAVVQLGGREQDGPFERLLHPVSRPIAAMRDGRWIFGRESVS